MHQQIYEYWRYYVVYNLNHRELSDSIQILGLFSLDAITSM
jgi:hypothetical protein